MHEEVIELVYEELVDPEGRISRLLSVMRRLADADLVIHDETSVERYDGRMSRMEVANDLVVRLARFVLDPGDWESGVALLDCDVRRHCRCVRWIRRIKRYCVAECWEMLEQDSNDDEDDDRYTRAYTHFVE